MTHIRHRRRPLYCLRYRVEGRRRTRRERREASEDHRRRLRAPYRARRRVDPLLRPRNGWRLVHVFGRGWAWCRGRVYVHRGAGLPCPWVSWPDLAPDRQEAHLAGARLAAPTVPLALGGVPTEYLFPVIRGAFPRNPLNDLVGARPWPRAAPRPSWWSARADGLPAPGRDGTVPGRGARR